MKVSTLLLSAVMLLGSMNIAQAACTPEEAQAKALEFSNVIQEKSQKDPQGYATAMQELQHQMLAVQQAGDMNALCDFYDAALAKLK